MHSSLAILALVLAVSQALPQHHGASSYSTFSTYRGGHQGGNRGGNAYAGFGNYGHQQSYVAAAPVAVAPIAKVVAPVLAVGKQVAHQIDYFAHPKYHFEYAVKDEHTGDVKSHHEERDGDNTRGYYTVNEPDGTILTVHYTVDKHSGFQAVVERTGHAAHPQQFKKVAVVAPVVHHAPILQHAPIVHHAPSHY
ncbi:cuticle protein 19-like [Ischnura elegans]|uniref:cuticle protein 19-like n=1 Tax=Ischnura elegans TaxID=197161 RepID=UPI001ED89F2E|nr:cuticle protein 19-like [Ischnura elegans]